MSNEKKPEGQEPQKPEGQAAPPSTPNQGPSVEELQKKNEEFQNQLKERDAKIADLETTNATIASRQRQIEAAAGGKKVDDETSERLRAIEERRTYDPEGASSDMAKLLSDVRKKASEDAVTQARSVIAQETTMDKIRNGVRSANPDFDDEIVDVIMERANSLASTGKYRTADEAVKAATDFVKSKFDNYAKKKNAVPPMPPGASAEGGGANQPPKAPEPPREKTALEELEEFNDTRYKKAM